MTPVRFAGVIAICLAATVAASPPGYTTEPGFAPIEVSPRQIASFGLGETRFGALEFRGGLQLSSTDKNFGGFSGLDYSADGETLYAVSDTGFWFTARPIQKDGRLEGIEQPRFAPILDANGKPFIGKNNADAEGLRIMNRGGHETALVSFEQLPAVSRYTADPDFATARRKPIKLPKFVNGMRPNRGLEGVAVAPIDGPLGGAIIAMAERALDRNGNHRGFILDGPRAGTFYLKRIGEFDVSDAAFLPDGDLVVLERSFSYTSGFGMRIRRVPVSTIRPGATVDGPVLIEADMSKQIDNMEGLAVHTMPNGEVRLTLVSDDNFNRFLQRTILLEFALIPSTPPKPIPRPG